MREMCYECQFAHSERCHEVVEREDLQAQLNALRVASFDFYAMVNGECPSLLEDNINAERLSVLLHIEKGETS